jgi:hypothetical protein
MTEPRSHQEVVDASVRRVWAAYRGDHAILVPARAGQLWANLRLHSR